jgi:hypothetical protein
MVKFVRQAMLQRSAKGLQRYLCVPMSSHFTRVKRDTERHERTLPDVPRTTAGKNDYVEKQSTFDCHAAFAVLAKKTHSVIVQ